MPGVPEFNQVKVPIYIIYSYDFYNDIHLVKGIPSQGSNDNKNILPLILSEQHFWGCAGKCVA